VGGLTGQEAAATPESYESVEIKQKRLGKTHLLVPFIFLTPRVSKFKFLSSLSEVFHTFLYLDGHSFQADMCFLTEIRD
jgi:hypothetical protein